jgi:hypothetical protein
MAGADSCGGKKKKGEYFENKKAGSWYRRLF